MNEHLTNLTTTSSAIIDIEHVLAIEAPIQVATISIPSDDENIIELESVFDTTEHLKS